MTNTGPLMVTLTNHSGQAATEVCISLPETPLSSFVSVAWGDGTSSILYGEVGNRLAHSYGNPSHNANYIVSVTGDASTVSFYDASGDRPNGKITSWGSYEVNKVIMPDLSIITSPIGNI